MKLRFKICIKHHILYLVNEIISENDVKFLVKEFNKHELNNTIIAVKVKL